jgi:hypothetical protein
MTPGSAALKRHNLKHPDRYRARQMLRCAVKSGKVARPANCSRCGRECIPDAHHPDYSKPLEVDWLCGDCHRAEHGKVSIPPADMERTMRIWHDLFD